MKKSILILLALLPVLAIAQKGSYVLKMTSVEIDGTSVGSFNTDSIKPSKITLYESQYRDSLIYISFKNDIDNIPFELTNKSKKNIKVIWNEAAYINYMNNSGKVMHVGVKYIDRNNDQPATSIIGGAKISDLFTPTENVYLSTGSYGGWRKRPLLPSVGRKEDKVLVGKEVKILLPIQSEGKQFDYVFTFDIIFNENQK